MPGTKLRVERLWRDKDEYSTAMGLSLERETVKNRTGRPRWLRGKESVCLPTQEMGVWGECGWGRWGGVLFDKSPGQEDHLEKEMQPTPVFLPGKSLDREAWQAKSQNWVRHDLGTKQTQRTRKGPQRKDPSPAKWVGRPGKPTL